MEDPPVVYNTSSLQENIIIKYFQNEGLISKEKYWPKCGDLMSISKRNDTIDKVAFRWYKVNPLYEWDYFWKFSK